MSTKTTTRAQPAVLEHWEVTWWQVDGGALVLHAQDFEMPGDARIAFASLHSSTSPGLVKHHWNIRAARWDRSDVVGQAVTPERAADVNARGFAAVHSILAHRAGHDSRAVGNLDEFLASDGKGEPDGEPLVGTSGADCTVCDYLCKYGLSTEDSHVTVVEQAHLDYDDITEPRF